MFETVDLYCERVAGGWLAEPFNALTNLAYFLAAWMLWRDARRRHNRSATLRVLLVLLCAVGAGSALFHLYANRLTFWLDVVPIVSFQVVFLWAYCREVAGMSRIPAGTLTLLFLAAVAAASGLVDFANGSPGYAPALVFLTAMAGYHAATGCAHRHAMVVAACVFFVALVFRSVDRAACAHFAAGTHFLWHIGSACVLYLVLSAWVASSTVAVRKEETR